MTNRAVNTQVSQDERRPANGVTEIDIGNILGMVVSTNKRGQS
jgi:hypothetical protein